jgi:hypothetical protein
MLLFIQKAALLAVKYIIKLVLLERFELSSAGYLPLTPYKEAALTVKLQEHLKVVALTPQGSFQLSLTSLWVSLPIWNSLDKND